MSTTIAAARATTTTSQRMWAVVDESGRVVVLFGGVEAEAEAAQWQARGYRIAEFAE